ncbi:MAG: ACP S-malonyltransferase [Deltaproteobacteria bacterium]|nr:ACP S-malonyltransferase [Deltaproteobacteria bacterium]MCX7952217.1 ACP S-malonyltransferase [Deltaproteobacteria bacterium]
MHKILGLFPGQGSQAVGMADDLVEKYLNFFETANRVLNFDLLNLMTSGPQEILTLTKWAQPAILTVSFVKFQDLQQTEGLQLQNYACFVGHSLGELSALLCSGVLDFETAVFLAHKRGEFMQDAVPEGKGGMIALVGLLDKKVFELAEENKVYVANFNSPEQVVFGGMWDNLNKFCESLKIHGSTVKIVPLRVSAPFHTPLLLPAKEKFSTLLETIALKLPQIPVISNVTALPYPNDPIKIRELLSDQIVHSVLFKDCVHYAVENYYFEHFIEIGFGQILTGLIKKNKFAITAFK